MSADPEHIPVKLGRCVELLAPALVQQADRAGAPRWVVDGTVGLGGHAEAMLRLNDDVHLLGIDRDPEALARSAARLAFAGDRVLLEHAVFDQLPQLLAAHDLDAVDGVLLDLGVSSLQLDEAARGFAYARDTPLDMRMNPDEGLTATSVLNEYPAKELARVFREYGEERFADRIARAVVAERGSAPLTSSAELVRIVRESVPAAARRSGGNPAKRVFQALRIEVNDELGALRRVLPALLASLSVGGRAVVLSYHSLEDRLVKRAFAAATSVDAPPGLPVEPEPPAYRLLTRGAEQASAAEAAANPRAASVRLRALVREAA